MPLPYKIKYGIKYLYLPPFTQQTGIFSNLSFTDKQVQKFVDYIPKQFKYYDINFNFANSKLQNNISIKNNFTPSLTRSYSDLYGKFSKNTKRNINKSDKNKLYIIKTLSVNDAIKSKQDNNINNLPNKRLKILSSLIKYA